MNWYKGDITEAVKRSKTRNAIFVVFVEGKDETTAKLAQFINEQKIRSKLESDDFVAIKIESESETYMQFATIYQVVPVPSIFFIGQSGTPIEIGTGIIASADELEEKIDKVLTTSSRSTPGVSAAASTTSLIAAEQAAAAKEPTPPVAQSVTEEDIVCEGDVCRKKPKESTSQQQAASVAAPTTDTAVQQAVTAVATEQPAATAAVVEDLAETRKLLEQKRRERIEEERKLEKESELRRRREGKEVLNLQQWQKEQELKELKENIRRERLEEQAARERIRAQIAGDRAEHAQKFSKEVKETTATSAASSSGQAKPPPVADDMTRLQFRFSSGNSKTNTFNCADTLGQVRAYVKTELLPGTGIRDFILATAYPKHEFTASDDTQTLLALNLVPSAVILIIAKDSSIAPSALIARSGGLVNIFSTLFWAMLSPVFAVFGFLKRSISGGGAAAEGGAQKRANEERGEAQQDAAKRRNLDRFMNGPSTSKDAASSASNSTDSESKAYRRYGGSNIHRLTDNRKDSDEENATWNGNSTQQQ